MALDVAGEVCVNTDRIFDNSSVINDDSFIEGTAIVSGADGRGTCKALHPDSCPFTDGPIYYGAFSLHALFKTADICFPSDLGAVEDDNLTRIKLFLFPDNEVCLEADIDEYDSAVGFPRTEEEKEYSIYDAVKQHAKNVELAEALNLLAQAAGYAYYGAILYACPATAGAYLALKILKDNNMLDQYCDPSKHEIALGYTACDIAEDVLHSFTIYGFGGKVSKFILGIAGWKGVALDAVAETLMKTLLLKVGENFENGGTPKAIDYLPSFSQVASSEVAKVAIKTAVSNTVPKPLQVVGQQLVGQGTKYVVRYFVLEEDQTGSELKTFGKAVSTTVCKTVLPEFKTNLLQSQAYTQCLKGMNNGVKKITSGISSALVYYKGEGDKVIEDTPEEDIEESQKVIIV